MSATESTTQDLVVQEGLARAGQGAEELLRWADERFAGKVALASSFGAEDVVLIDLWCRVAGTPRIFTLDTGRLPQETYDVMERIREKYGVTFEVYSPDAQRVEEMVGSMDLTCSTGVRSSASSAARCARWGLWSGRSAASRPGSAGSDASRHRPGLTSSLWRWTGLTATSSN